MSEWMRRSGIQLASPFEEKRFKRWGSEAIIQPKLDGDRCRAVFDSYGNVTLYSSEENEILGTPHINEELNSLRLRNIELDGELYIHGIPQSEIHGMVSSQRVELHPAFDEVELRIFDLIDQDSAQAHRLLNLKQLDEEKLYKLNYIHRVDFSIVRSLEEVYEHLEQYVEKENYEGFILRHIWSTYIRRRSIYMMKFKPGREDIYTIVGLNEAISKNGKPKGMVGSFICKGNQDKTTFPIGAGKLTHDERVDIWAKRDIVPGNLLHIAFQHMTSKNGVPRSGRAIKIIWNEEIN